MSSSHKWSFRFDCVSCNEGGAVSVTEDSGPPFDDAPRRTYQLSKGFERDAAACAVRCGLRRGLRTRPRRQLSFARRAYGKDAINAMMRGLKARE